MITHDLGVMAETCDRVAVMYAGNVVETGSVRDVLKNPQHPYTQSLLSAIMLPDPEVEQSKPPLSLTGEALSPINPPPGCRFYSRCPKRMDICTEKDPILGEIEKEHFVACFAVDSG